MHALGIDHEQNRPDRDDHIDLDWDNVQRNKRHNFEILQSEEWIDTGHPYEYASVMHYDAFDFAIDSTKPIMTKIVNGKKTNEVIRSQRIRPTTTDTSQICELYGCQVHFHKSKEIVNNFRLPVGTNFGPVRIRNKFSSKDFVTAMQTVPITLTKKTVIMAVVRKL